MLKSIKLSYQDYLDLKEKSDNILEYIDGIVHIKRRQDV